LGPQVGATAHMAHRAPSYPARLRSRLEATQSDRTLDWQQDELEAYLRDWKGLDPNTIAQRLRDLTRMATHPVRPVRLKGRVSDIVESFYEFYTYRRDVEQKAPTALANDFKAVRQLGGFLQIAPEVWPTRPTIPRRAREILPSPEQVYELLHAKYVPDAKNNYEQALIKYLLVLDFGFGPRFPSELHELRVRDLDAKRHTLVVTEPKKGSPSRRLLIEPAWLCCHPFYPSLAQYLRWRKRVDVGGTDAFFLKPNGEPFDSKHGLSNWLNQRVKPRFPWFHGYMGRKWCANARLIDSGHDHARVADWLGHESVDMLRREYEHDARIHESVHGKNWLNRAFKAPYGRQSGENARSVRSPKEKVEMLPAGSSSPERSVSGHQYAREAASVRLTQASDGTSPSDSPPFLVAPVGVAA
jgi:integrase